jgi:hypothetical protein
VADGLEGRFDLCWLTVDLVLIQPALTLEIARQVVCCCPCDLLVVCLTDEALIEEWDEEDCLVCPDGAIGDCFDCIWVEIYGISKNGVGICNVGLEIGREQVCTFFG